MSLTFTLASAAPPPASAGSGSGGPLLWLAVGCGVLLVLVVLVAALSGAGQGAYGETSGIVPRRERPGIVRAAQRALCLNGALFLLAVLLTFGPQEGTGTVAAAIALAYGVGCLVAARTLGRPSPTAHRVAMALQFPLVVFAAALAVIALAVGQPLLLVGVAVPLLMALNAGSLLYKARGFYLAQA
ncbi:hypothetical protein HNR06_004928 [Nocardiopsis arvandica]|uniref:Uncharacterized protein n=1 Tax=Nocardiopsis sinuspersici TaxID=501010 RepID=A0A7Z0BNC0_9ACTN|nr:hypothetical protein [Nocardiopsis sinuspersici]NYH55339.1 hypothetical protein [Nocardiopsis sinuspersici]